MKLESRILSNPRYAGDSFYLQCKVYLTFRKSHAILNVKLALHYNSEVIV
jgi:hypothetical protein